MQKRLYFKAILHLVEVTTYYAKFLSREKVQFPLVKSERNRGPHYIL